MAMRLALGSKPRLWCVLALTVVPPLRLSRAFPARRSLRFMPQDVRCGAMTGPFEPKRTTSMRVSQKQHARTAR
jgi:hypothetical protein